MLTVTEVKARRHRYETSVLVAIYLIAGLVAALVAALYAGWCGGSDQDSGSGESGVEAVAAGFIGSINDVVLGFAA